MSDRPFQPIKAEILEKFYKLAKNIRLEIIALTNRPPAQLGVASAFLSGKFHLTESGGTAWVPQENRFIVNPHFKKFLSQKVRIMKEIVEEIGELDPLVGKYMEEAGQKQIVITIAPIPPNTDISELPEKLSKRLKKYKVEFKPGGGFDVFPRGMTKKDGCLWLEKLYQKYYQKSLNWHRVIYLGDSSTDLPAMEYIIGLGGAAAVVGNAKDEVKKTTLKINGYVAKKNYMEGVIEAIQAINLP